jgi:hypothetical protein
MTTMTIGRASARGANARKKRMTKDTAESMCSPRERKDAVIGTWRFRLETDQDAKFASAATTTPGRGARA